MVVNYNDDNPISWTAILPSLSGMPVALRYLSGEADMQPNTHMPKHWNQSLVLIYEKVGINKCS